MYDELHRPQYHFTAREHWLNDPNGLVFYDGEYHLFFQHNPDSVKWGNMTWGHAVSPDLLHWEQLDHALLPDDLGTIFSGSAVIDWQDTSGLRTGDEKTMVALYTSAGEHAALPVPFTQSMAYSNDRGRTWTKYDQNPVIGHIRAQNRDPKVIWHEPSGHWIMALYLDDSDYALFRSEDLTNLQRTCGLNLPGVTECPDFFELPVDGNSEDRRWVFWGSCGGYLIGGFDGIDFVPETDVMHAEYGSNGYAAQTWSDLPAADGRRIQISWMADGKFPSMPFNQQMSFPVTLTLSRFEDGIRLCRAPIVELERLRTRTYLTEPCRLLPGKNLIPETIHDLLDIEISVEPASAHAFGLVVRGHTIEYDCFSKTISCLGKEAPVVTGDSEITLRFLVDRTSVEIFSGDGRISMSHCFLPEAADVPIECFVRGGELQIVSLRVHELASIWSTP
ncbi:MAG: glycoside hydrolase family 32 protein [Candidatus Latescibacteria bacterium]|nr:glycoside hydrolase family 32 protein [Candidatus Latescibacterota bacterium]